MWDFLTHLGAGAGSMVGVAAIIYRTIKTILRYREQRQLAERALRDAGADQVAEILTALTPILRRPWPTLRGKDSTKPGEAQRPKVVEPRETDDADS